VLCSPETSVTFNRIPAVIPHKTVFFSNTVLKAATENLNKYYTALMKQYKKRGIFIKQKTLLPLSDFVLTGFK
jgi:hypothetical protein